MQEVFLHPHLSISISFRNLSNLIFFGFVLVVDEFPKFHGGHKVGIKKLTPTEAELVAHGFHKSHKVGINIGKLTPREAGLKAHREAEEKILQAQQKIQPQLEVVETMTAEEKSKKEREDGLKLHRAAEEKILQAQRESGGLI